MAHDDVGDMNRAHLHVALVGVMMPKGRGSNQRRRSDRQRRPKDKRDSTGRGYLKLRDLGEQGHQGAKEAS